MNVEAAPTGINSPSGYVVRAPRATDALGKALRGIFVDTPPPADFVRLLRRLDGVAH